MKPVLCKSEESTVTVPADLSKHTLCLIEIPPIREKASMTLIVSEQYSLQSALAHCFRGNEYRVWESNMI